jgi:hypothetical protein
MTAFAIPTAPPMRSVAPAAPAAPAPVAAAPAPVLDFNDIAGAIAASPDAAALLSHLVLAVASRAVDAAGQGHILSAVHGTAASMLKAVHEALLASVNEAPGVYDGFTIYSKNGSRSVDYTRLEAQYPDVYAEIVKVGSPSLAIKYA